MRPRLLPALLLILICCSRGTDTAEVATAPEQAPAVQPSSSAPIRQGAGVIPPVAVKRVDPDHAACAGEKLWGMPIIETVIDERGDVRAARLLQDVHPCLGRVALAAVRQWKFRPATLDGRPVAVYYNLTVRIHYR